MDLEVEHLTLSQVHSGFNKEAPAKHGNKRHPLLWPGEDRRYNISADEEGWDLILDDNTPSP
jgi:hypothetical protein